MMNKPYLFDNVLDVAGFYINELSIENQNHEKIEPFPLKIHQILYVTWAIYGATYGTEPAYPDMLFPADFAPTKYGPIIVKLAQAYQKNTIPKQTWITIKDKMNLAPDIQDPTLNDIETMLGQYEQDSIFTLIINHRNDKAFKIADEEHTKLDPDTVINEYKKRIEDYFNK